MPPRTIDNLGVEISTRYAEDQKILEQSYIKEARGISPHTEIDVTVPSFPSEFETLFELQHRNITWASFYAPPRYAEQKKRIFSYQIIPALGSDDLKEAQSLKIKANIQDKVEKRKKQQEDRGEKEKKQLRWEEEREIEEEEKEEKILLKLLNSVSILDRFLSDINSRRNQYQKG